MGIGPIIGGFLADYFANKSLHLDFTWITQNGAVAIPAIQLVGFDFLFIIAFVFSLLSLNLLVALQERGELPRSVAAGGAVGAFDAGQKGAHVVARSWTADVAFL